MAASLMLVGAACVVACATGGPFSDDPPGGNGGADGGRADGVTPGRDGGPPDDSGNPPPDDSGKPPDGGCVPPPGASCGLAPQCGCSPTQTCDLTSNTGSTRCITAGTGTLGKPCSSTGQCAPGLTCNFLETCHAYCATAGQACPIPGTGKCYQAKSSTGTDIPNFKVCPFECKLDDPNSCGGTAGCVAVDTIVDCAKVGTSTAGCPNGPDDCAPGYACAGVGDAGRCFKWCKVGGPASFCNPQSSRCNAFSPKVIIDGVEYGGCYN